MVHSRIKNTLFFLLFFLGFYLTFYYNPWSFESFIVELDEENHFTFKKLLSFEKNLFYNTFHYYFESNFPNNTFSSANGRMMLGTDQFIVNNYNDIKDFHHLANPIGAVKFFYYYFVKFLIFLNFEDIDTIFYLYLNFNFILGVLFISMYSFNIYKKYSLFPSLISFTLLTFCAPIYIFLRSPSIFTTVFLSLFFIFSLNNPLIKSKKKFIKYYLIGFFYFTFCFFFHKAGFYILILGCFFPIFYNLDANNIFNLKNFKLVFFALLIVIFSFLINYLLEFIFFNEFRYDQVGLFNRLYYYIVYENILDHLLLILGSARLLFDTFIVFLPFFHVGQSPYDLSQLKEIRILSTYNTLIIIFLMRFMSNQNQILKKYFLVILLNIIAIIIYLSLFPVQTFDFHYTMYWMIFPLFFFTTLYLSLFCNFKIKKMKLKKITNLILLSIISIGLLRILYNNGEIKYLSLFS